MRDIWIKIFADTIWKIYVDAIQPLQEHKKKRFTKSMMQQSRLYLNQRVRVRSDYHLPTKIPFIYMLIRECYGKV